MFENAMTNLIDREDIQELRHLMGEPRNVRRFLTNVAVREPRNMVLLPVLINKVLTLTLLLIDSYGIKLNPKATEIINQALRGRESEEEKLMSLRSNIGKKT